MNEKEVRKRAFAMPLTSPAYPLGPYRFVNREFFIIAYRTDPDKLKAVIPAPLEFTEPIVKYEFIRMPDSTGFGDYTESGQVIPVSFRGEKGGYVHSMYLDCDPPIAGGRELWGFPKHRPLDNDKVRVLVEAPGFLLKIIPHVDGTPRICEIVRYQCGDVTVHGAWSGPGALELFHHALAPVADLPVLEVLSATHILCDLTLNLGTVVHDYLAPERKKK
jgi:acetoacetate decarboxylase